ncbi:MAG TPA: hypothetical protein VFF40_11530 [Acidimicrobiia bacterium]|nr:hypothetical protein [Acidimicrobiia bacterium]
MGDHPTALLRAGARRDRWLQVTKIDGEETFAGEAASNEYLDPRDQMTGRAEAMMTELGWTDVEGADFIRFDAAATREQRRKIASVLVETLVTVYGHDPKIPPRIEFPS